MKLFDNEKEKELEDRVYRMEILNNETIKAIASINETLREMNEKLDAKPEIVAEPGPEFGAAEVPAPVETLRETIDELISVNKCVLQSIGDQMNIIREIRSHMAETNSLLSAILKKMEEPKPMDPPQVPIYPTQTQPLPPSPSWTISNKGTTGGPLPDVSCDANPYPLHDDSLVDVSKLEPKPLNDEEKESDNDDKDVN